MSSEDPKPDQPGAEGEEKAANPAGFLDPTKADEVAEREFKSKYGIKKAPSSMAQRKISATGGKQYFDSGDYNSSANRSVKKDIASHPHAMNPHLARMRAKAVVHKTQPSKLAS